jgi:membrane-associated protein
MTIAFLDNLIDMLTGSLWAYPLLFGICVGDAVAPLLPSETAMIVGGIQAARGELSLGWVLAVGAAGAFCGDNASYACGRWIGEPLIDRFFTGKRSRELLSWAARFLKERGSYVLIVARFVPGGRTATTFTAGVVRLPWLTQFVPYVLIAALFWSAYAGLLGYLGGRVFRNQPIYALLIAFGIAAAVAGVAELLRWLRKRG